jgi:alkanesulfonate monooxygenase SsuD/methylene tetrahydromethanopterin reductase-like flavin-dependent oxidoreductase (luciferase family)
MKIGFIYNPSRNRFAGDYQKHVEDARSTARFLEDSGFDSIWFGEHHFGFYGFATMPNPIMMGADIAARTSKIRIGLASATITFWHPLRLAEDLALLDQFSNGRLEIGVGRGNHAIEGYNLNPMADPRQPEENFAVFKETLDILRLALSQKSFSYQGEKYQFPRPGFTWDKRPVKDPAFVDQESGEVISLPLMPPMVQAAPPFWQMVSSENSIEFAAENDLGIISWRPPVARLKSMFKKHNDAANKAGHNLNWGKGTGILRDTFTASSFQEAERVAGPVIMNHLNWANWRGPDVYLNPEEKLPQEEWEALKKELTYDFVHPRSLLFGPPEYIVDKLQEMKEELNIELVIINGNFDGIDDDVNERSLRMFAEKVIPKVS